MLICKIKKTLPGFTLDVDIATEHRVTALMGASGCGKSMTLRCIAGVVKPDEGHIELNGKVLFDSANKIDLPPQKRNVGFLFQDYALFPNMTARQNIMCGVRDKPRREKLSIAQELAKTFRIEPHLDKYPHQMSGGEKQRCALARIFAGTPDILMLDEPFAALDSHLREDLEKELSALFERFHKPIIFVSHNPEEVRKLCDSVITMSDGMSGGVCSGDGV